MKCDVILLVKNLRLTYILGVTYKKVNENGLSISKKTQGTKANS